MVTKRVDGGVRYILQTVFVDILFHLQEKANDPSIVLCEDAWDTQANII
jgi:hypothetical protein